jgi:transcriptional regulator with XRE-family HTH domain
MLFFMDDSRVGRVIREVRIRKAWRQRDLADAAGVSQGLISRIELGRFESLSLGKIRKVGEVLGITVGLDAWWRSGNIDRLVDRGHAALVDHVVATLSADGWVTRVEVTFNHFGERGAADVVAWHPRERILLIVEVKTRIGDIQAMASTFERKVRILPDAIRTAAGWRPRTVARLLVIAETHANRTVIRDHPATFDAIWPARTTETRRWLRRPSISGDERMRGFGGVWFLPFECTTAAPARCRQVQRVRRPRPAA